MAQGLDGGAGPGLGDGDGLGEDQIFLRSRPGGPEEQGDGLAVIVLQAETGGLDAGRGIGTDREVPEGQPAAPGPMSSPQRRTACQERPKGSRARPTD